MAELDSNAHALPLDATPSSRAMPDDNETGAVALGRALGSYTDAYNELNPKGEAKFGVADAPAGPQSRLKYGFPIISGLIEVALICYRGEDVILVMGATGVGKSSFIKRLTNLKVKTNYGHEPCKPQYSPLYASKRAKAYAGNLRLRFTPLNFETAASSWLILQALTTSLKPTARFSKKSPIFFAKHMPMVPKSQASFTSIELQMFI